MSELVGMLADFVSESLEGSELNYKVKLSVDGNSVEIFSGNITAVDIDFQLFGFEGRAHFTSYGDEKLDALMAEEKPIKFDIECALSQEIEGIPSPLWKLSGYVAEKHVKRKAVSEQEKLASHYMVLFADPARVIWSHHFPVDIYVDKTMKDVIEEHVTPDMSIKYDWDLLEEECPVIAFALTNATSVPGESGASFYDFLIWYLHREGGMLAFDYTDGSYTICGEKPEAKEKAAEVFETLVESPIIHAPRLPRFEREVLTHACDKLQVSPTKLFDPFQKVTEDLFDKEIYREFPEQVQIGTEAQPVENLGVLEVCLEAFSPDFHMSHMLPGSLCEFVGHNKQKGTWSEESDIKGKAFRIRSFEMRSLKQGEFCSYNQVGQASQPYTLQVRLWLEDKEEKQIDLPAFRVPRFPFYIQGEVFSDVGAPEQSTFDIDEKVPQGQFLVKIPRVEGDGKVVVPFTPTMVSGQYYFPLCKGEKVLLAMHFQTAQFCRVLDWQPLTRLPSGVQGNQVVFASKGKDYYTWMRHEFEGGSDSVYTIEQSSSETQKRKIEIKDKVMSFTVVNPEKKEISVVYDEEKGMALTVKDHSSNIEQTTTYDGKAMTHICKGEKTSQIVQKPDAIEVKVETFSIEATDIHLKAKNEILGDGGSTVGFKSSCVNIDSSNINLGS